MGHDAPEQHGTNQGMLEVVVATINSLRGDLHRRHENESERLERLEQSVADAVRAIDDIKKGFPDGDADGHRRYHESVIERNAARAAWYNALRTDLTNKGVWAVLVILGTLIVLGGKNFLSDLLKR